MYSDVYVIFISQSAKVRFYRLCSSGGPHFSFRLSESLSQAQHQVVGVFELAELITRMKEEVASEEGLQCQYLIESFGVLSFVEDVVPDTDVDGENGHDQFGTYRQAYGELFAEGWSVEFRIVIGASGIMSLQVGAFVKLCVERHACPETFVEVVHRVEVEADNAERAGYQMSHVVVVDVSPFACRSIYDEVVAEVGVEIVRQKLSGVARRSTVLCSEGPYQADSPAYRVHSAVRVMGVSVGVVGQVDSRCQVPLGIDLPVQEEAQIDVGIDLRAYHVVVTRYL